MTNPAYLAKAVRQETSALKRERNELQARVGRLLDLLREVEWAGDLVVDEEAGRVEVRICPVCEATQRYGHEPTCRLREELWA